MSDNQAAKVIQFPGKMKDVAAPSASVAPAPASVVTPAPAPKRLVKKANSAAGVGILAIILATVAVNRYAYRAGPRDQSRAIASAQPELERDAAWEKSLAERLARPGSVNAVAQVGRAPTLTEDLRFAALEDKFTIAFRPDGRSIAAINPNESGSREALVIDRAAFLKKYGQLFDGTFASAELKSVDRSEGKVTESYELRDRGGQVKVRAFFELGEQDQLLTVRAVQI